MRVCLFALYLLVACGKVVPLTDGSVPQRDGPHDDASAKDAPNIDAPPGFVTLTVTRTGNGTVTSASGINCGATCSVQVVMGTQVTLAASPATDGLFTGWSGGGCSGTAACTVTMTANTSVATTFTCPGSPATLNYQGAIVT